MTRLALIHALAHSVAPINDVLARQWPQAMRANLLDDSLSADLARNGGVIDHAMSQRFEVLSDYAVSSGADGILFTCSAFGPCIEAVARRHPALPVLKPNEAMIGDACAAGGPIGLVASFGPTLLNMPREFPPGTALKTALAAGAMAALDAGDGDGHDRAVLAAAVGLREQGCEVIALAQFSLARSAPLLRQVLDCPVLTTPDSAVSAMQRRLGVA